MRGGAGAQQVPDRQPAFAAELRQFLGENKKWWLLPMVVALLLIVALIFVGDTRTADFIYTLF